MGSGAASSLPPPWDNHAPPSGPGESLLAFSPIPPHTHTPALPPRRAGPPAACETGPLGCRSKDGHEGSASGTGDVGKAPGWGAGAQRGDSLACNLHTTDPPWHLGQAPGQTWRCAWMGLAEKPEMRRTPTQAGHPETPPPTHPAQTTTPWHLVGWGERATGTESLHHCKCKSVLFTFIPQGNAWHIVGAQSICATWTEKGRKDLYCRVTMGLKVVFFLFCLFLIFFCKTHIAFFNVGKRKSYFKTVSLRSLWPQGN